ncbi:MAG TPA: hypothetical protein VGF88_16495 [Acidobacteriaceae bacterium]|jgi:hypothetical protein
MSLRLRYGIDVAEAKRNAPREVRIVMFSDAGQQGEVTTVAPVVKTDAEVEAAVVAGCV